MLCACAAQPVLPANHIAPTSCADAGLRIQYAGSDTQDGSVTIGVLVTNILDTPCALLLVPQLQFLASDGRVLPIDYHLLKESPANSSWLVEAKQAVSFLVVWKNWCKAPVGGGVRISAFLSAGSKAVAVPTTGTPLEQSTIYAGAVCTQPAQPAEVWVGQFSNQVPPPCTRSDFQLNDCPGTS